MNLEKLTAIVKKLAEEHNQLEQRVTEMEIHVKQSHEALTAHVRKLEISHVNLERIVTRTEDERQ